MSYQRERKMAVGNAERRQPTETPILKLNRKAVNLAL